METRRLGGVGRRGIVARERKQPVRRILWQLVLFIPKPVRRALWEGLLELPGPLRRFLWAGIVKKDRLVLDFSVPDTEVSATPPDERRRRYPLPQMFDVIILADPDSASADGWSLDVGRDIASTGHRVFYVGDLDDAARRRSVDVVEDGIYVIRGSRDGGATSEPGSDAITTGEETSWSWLRYECHTVDAVCVATSEAAVVSANLLRRRFGWKVVEDRRKSAELSSGADTAVRQQTADLVIVDDDVPRGGPAGSDSCQRVLSPSARADNGSAHHLIAAMAELYPKVSIILLMYNGLEYNRLCLDSLFGKTAYPNFEVIVVDNNSTDGTRELLQATCQRHPNLKVILNDKNEGYTRGNNQGAAASTGDVLIFLNNDTILTRSWLSRLVFYLGDRQVGLVGPTSSWPGNESGIDTDYHTLTELHAFADRYTREHEGLTYNAGRMVFFCAATRRDVFEEIGPLDERFSKGVSFEDDDYTMRVRQKGYRIIYAEDAFVHHWGVGTNSRRDMKAHWRLIEINRRQFEEKWGITWDPNRGVEARRR
jgi:GT2 family glycosyltransferase